MVLYVPGYTKDVFGGPAGTTQQALAGLVESLMARQQKQKAEQEQAAIAALLGQAGANQEAQETGTLPSGAAMNLPAQPEGMESNPYTAIAQQIIQNPTLSPAAKAYGMKMLEAKHSFEPTMKEEKNFEISYYNKAGEKQPPLLVRESQVNATAAQLANSGYKFDAPKPAADPEYVRLLNQLEKARGEGNTARAEAIEAHLRKLNHIAPRGGGGGGDGRMVKVEWYMDGKKQVDWVPKGSEREFARQVESSGGEWDKPGPERVNTVKIGNELVSRAELRQMYNNEFGLVSASELARMEVEDPVLYEKVRKRQAEKVGGKPSFDAWVNTQRQLGGLPGSPSRMNLPDVDTMPFGTKGSKMPTDQQKEAPPPKEVPPPTPEQAKKFLRRAGWNGKGKPTPEQIDNATRLYQTEAR
jgi:hypothetical protein